MTKREYNILAKKYSPEELVEGYIFPSGLTKKEKQKTDAALIEVLKQRRMAMDPDVRLQGMLLQLRFQIEDYLNDASYDKHKTFGYFLRSYIDGLRKKRNEFAHEINIKPTELSQYINNHRKPPQNIMIRLELHSRNMIPATDWYKLLEKEAIHKLGTNRALRKEERKFIVREAQFN